jgi:hypothetical protein
VPEAVVIPVDVCITFLIPASEISSQEHPANIDELLVFGYLHSAAASLCRIDPG